MNRLLVAATAAILLASTTASGRTFLTQQQALASAFPSGTKVVRQAYFLTAQQVKEARRSSGVEFSEQLLVRYAGMSGERVIGYAYFDTHRVRTLPETIMVVVTADAKVQRIEILSFDEPPDYFPKRRWIDQIHGRKLDDDLTTTRAIRPMSGASLTAQAIVKASRKVLAIHEVIENAPPR